MEKRRKKRGYTTYPIGPLSYVRTVQAIEEALGSLLSALKQDYSYFQWECYLRWGLTQFNCRVVDLSLTEHLADAEDYWVQTGYTERVTPLAMEFSGTFTLPRNLARVSVYNIQAVDYAHVMAWTMLPNLRILGNEAAVKLYFGLENGAALYNGLLCWELNTDTLVTNQLRAFVGVAPFYNSVSVNLDSYKPANFLMENNVYQIQMSKNLAIFRINGNPVLFVIPCGRLYTVKENIGPYSIVLVHSLPSTLTPFMEIWTDRTQAPTVPPYDTVAPISPYRFRFVKGQEITGLNLPLYVEDTATLFQGSVVAAGTLTSHPFPTMGFTSKTVKIRTSQNGVLSLQEYLRTSTWVEYDTMNTVANTLETMDIVNEHILTRAVFTPAAYPCTVTHGEVDLS